MYIYLHQKWSLLLRYNSLLYVELNAYSDGRRHLVNVQEKWKHNSGEMPWNRGEPSSDVAFQFLFRVGRNVESVPFLFLGKQFNYVHPTGGVDILFLLFPASAVRHAWCPVISRKSIYPMFTIAL